MLQVEQLKSRLMEAEKSADGDSTSTTSIKRTNSVRTENSPSGQDTPLQPTDALKHHITGTQVNPSTHTYTLSYSYFHIPLL